MITDVPTADAPIPQEWTEFLDWLDQTYPDRIALTPAARRMVKAPEFEDVALVARCISWLASDHYDRRLMHGAALDPEVRAPQRGQPIVGKTVHWTVF